MLSWIRRGRQFAAIALTAAVAGAATPSLSADPLNDPYQNGIRIVGGQPAKQGELPWQVALVRRSDNFPFCSGTIIRARWVLTAAHCLDKNDGSGQPPTYYSASEIKIQYGTVKLSSGGKIADVADGGVVPYPTFDRSKTGFASDLALLRLKSDISLDSNAKTLDLLEDGSLASNNTNVTAAGWGTTDKPGPPDTLQYVGLRIVGEAKCKQSYPELVAAIMICAGDPDATKPKGTCDGDSGSPLVMMKPPSGKDVDVGILSFRSTCSDPYMYSVYTRVSAFKGWIDGIVDKPS